MKIEYICPIFIYLHVQRNETTQYRQHYGKAFYLAKHVALYLFEGCEGATHSGANDKLPGHSRPFYTFARQTDGDV